MRKVNSGSTAPITMRDTKIIFGKCRGGVMPQLYAAANSSGARMFAMERKFERPAAISPRPKPRREASAVRSVSTPSRLRSPRPCPHSDVQQQIMRGSHVGMLPWSGRW